MRLLVAPPSAVIVLSEDLDAGLSTLTLAATHQLTGRRIHDARHAAAALVAGIAAVYTYDVEPLCSGVANAARLLVPVGLIPRLQIPHVTRRVGGPS